MKAIWNGTVVAESDDTVVFEGDHYFPADALKREYVLMSHTRSMCSLKGEMQFSTLFVDGDTLPDAVWACPSPREGAAAVRGRVAFGRGVQIVA